MDKKKLIPVFLLFYPAIEGLFVAFYYATDSLVFVQLFPLIGGVSFVFGLSHNLTLVLFSLVLTSISPIVARFFRINPWKLIENAPYIKLIGTSTYEQGNIINETYDGIELVSYYEYRGT